MNDPLDKSDAGDPDAPAVMATAVELRVVLGQLRRRLREQASPGDLTPSQVAVLRRLDNGPATVTALAKAEGVRSQSLGATVGTLEVAGLVAGSPDPADGRQTLWDLTPACREWLRVGRAAREDWLFRTMRARLTPDERADLGRAVDLLKRLVAD
ncbi:MarR family winged helix-turn-helix transcriptional regulator [Nitrospirillum iridis]|uniref:DNA-binding MarR family transcriptional regulator n=1 Tax=Nitrospirillum iridis TaxID=765888 RepID=A0A7X0AZE4_9PROT|nr:MarR family transcriptional regulator [Nitrospirillum iridis]MBB6251496.1 DNA-binding MarR family transcriptional regulator [Nitrospirillum iridis]